MRVFIAYELPEKVSIYLRQKQKEIETDSARMVFPKQFHLTFKFLGEKKEQEIEQIKKDLNKIDFKPINAKLNGTGVFQNEERINVFWAGLEPKEDIIKLQKQIDEDERFHPHITIARIKSVKEKEKLKSILDKVELKEMEFEINKIKLIKSILTTEGPNYEELACIKAKPL